jgi:hypothetical protein
MLMNTMGEKIRYLENIVKIISQKSPVITQKNDRKVFGSAGKAVYVVMGLLRKTQETENEVSVFLGQALLSDCFK